MADAGPDPVCPVLVDGIGIADVRHVCLRDRQAPTKRSFARSDMSLGSYRYAAAMRAMVGKADGSGDTCFSS